MHLSAALSTLDNQIHSQASIIMGKYSENLYLLLIQNIGHQKTYLRDGESNPGLPRSVEQVWASSDMTGGDTYHYTITDMMIVE